MIGKKNNIGIPKFYSTWINQFKTKRTKKNLLIILPSVVENIFSKKDFENWLKDIFLIIKKSKNPVIVKPHPMQTEQEIFTLRKKQRIKINNLKISNNHSSLLLQNAKLVFLHIHLCYLIVSILNTNNFYQTLSIMVKNS